MNLEEKIVQPAKSSSTKSFSSGLRILAVDDDVTYLKTVETMLQACKYEVVAVKNSFDALFALREKQGGFDLILMDVHMPDMDGISLLKKIGLEYKIPIVMMSADNNKEHVMRRCLRSGASVYLAKPPSMDDLRSLRKFVFKMRSADMTVIEQTESVLEASSLEKVSEDETASPVNENNWGQESNRKRPVEKDQEKMEDGDEPAFQKKPRLLWNAGLHYKFLEAIDTIGIDKAVPKKILELMNVPGLTIAHVASHLQKLRIHVRQRKESSKSAESNIANLLNSGGFVPSFASSHPLIRFNLKQGFPCIPEQQHQLTYGNLLPTSSQGKLNQPLLGTGSSHNQRNDANHSGFNVEPHNTRMGSSLYVNILTGLVTSMGTSQMINQQPLVRTGHFTNGSLEHNLKKLSISRNSNRSVGSMGEFSNLNYAGVQMTKTRDLIDLNKMPIDFEQADGTNYSCNMMDEIFQGNITPEAAGKSPLIPEFTSLHSDYASQWLSSSSGFASENHIPTMFTNVIQQQPPVPPLILPQQQQNGIGVKEEVDSQFPSIKNSSTRPQSFGESNRNDLSRWTSPPISNKFVKK